MIQLEDENQIMLKKLNSIEEQMTNFNRINDDNLKNIVKLYEINDKLRERNEVLFDKIDKSEKIILKINNELLRFIELDKSIKENNSNIEETTKNLNDFQYNSTKKFSEIDSNFLNIVNTLQEIGKQSNQGSLQIGAHLSNISTTDNSQVAIEQINKTNKEFEIIKKINREHNEKIEKILKSNQELKDIIDTITIKLNNIQNNPIQVIEKQEQIIKEKSIELIPDITKTIINFNENEIKPSQSIEIIYDKIQKIQDAIKILSNIISSKPTKEEMEKTSRVANSEIEKLSTKFNELNKTYEGKFKSLLQSLSEKKNNFQHEILKENVNHDIDQVEDSVRTITKHILDIELPSKISDYIENSNKFKINEEILLKIETHKIDIEHIIESLAVIKKMINDREATKTDTILNEINKKFSDLDLIITKQKFTFEEKFRRIEGDGFNLDEELNSNNQGSTNPALLTFSDAIKILQKNIKMSLDKIDKITIRQDNTNNEILIKVKKDLAHESGKILEEFRNDLKISTGKIEDQLREKVDRFSLDEFGKRVDNKLTNEFNKKIDRTDLKKNNNLINKKIDTLENKISRTLVDTLIDLQMDDTPLIIKKSLNGEKCASCNQIVPGTGHQIINSIHLDDECKHNTTQAKFKIRNIQDNSNKFGTGSYSRFLSNAENVTEELKLKINLPDISTKHIKKNSMGKTFTKLRVDEYTGRHFNSMISEELEKNILNPDNLIKTANKFYDNIEKRHNMKDK